MVGNDSGSLVKSHNEVEIHPQVGEVIDAFLAQLNQYDKENFSGLYLTGSITQQDFHPSKSDIDFVVLCNIFHGEKMQQHLVKVHKEIAKKFPRSTLNGWYITRSSLAFDPVVNVPAFLYEKGKLTRQSPGISPVTLHELTTNGICVFGIPVNELSIRLSHVDVNDFLFRNINSYWTNWIEPHNKYPTRKLLLLLFPRFTEWVILGISRQYYTLMTGCIASKTKAGHFALLHIPKVYHEIIREAICIRNKDQVGGWSLRNAYAIKPSFQRYNKTVACARFIIKQFNTDYKKSHSNV